MTNILTCIGCLIAIYLIYKFAFKGVRSALMFQWSDNRIVGKWPVRGRVWVFFKRYVLKRPSSWN